MQCQTSTATQAAPTTPPSSALSPPATIGRRTPPASVLFDAVFIASVAALWIAAPPDLPSIPVLLGLMVLLCLGVTVSLPFGNGNITLSQAAFVTALFVISPALVPVLMWAALALTSLLPRQRYASSIRVIGSGADALHTLPLCVLAVAAGSPNAADSPGWLLPTGLALQVLLTIGIETARDVIDLRARPRIAVYPYMVLIGGDAVGASIGYMAALASLQSPLAPIGVAALLLFQAALSHERTGHIDHAHQRLSGLQRERQRLQIAVRRIGEAFASQLDLDALLDVTMRASLDAIGGDAARASSWQGAGRQLVRRATAHEHDDVQGALSTAERSVETSGCASLAMVDGVWAFAVPVQDPDGQIAGIISVAQRLTAFTAEERDLVEHLCNQAGVAAAQIARHETLHRQALTDELTGLANHRRLQEVLGHAVARHRRHAAPVALLLLDLDDFKSVNDERGHQTGDRVLRAAGDVLRGCCRAEDEPARYGGEELAVLVPEVRWAEAVALAERIRAAIADLEVIDAAGQRFGVTASIGVAQLGATITDGSALIQAADEALYEAKRAGKNCVRVQAHGDHAQLKRVA